MNDRELRSLLKKGKFHNQYLLIGDEPLLIDNTITLIKDTIGVDVSFDYDTFFASDSPIEEIISKYYLAPFSSTRRLVVVKYLEELDVRALANFAKVMNSATSQNCLVMSYRIKKDNKKYDNKYQKLEGQFNKATCITFQSSKALIRKWINLKIQRDNIKLTPTMIQYLEDEFKSDITGLKNEFLKIENYLHEVGEINTNNMKDLAQGLCDFDKYYVVDAFLKGRENTIETFEELKPYLRSYAEIVDALTRGLVYHTQRRTKYDRTTLTTMLDDMIQVDRKIKQSTAFAPLMMELFFLKNARLFKKGAVNGR